MPINSRRGNLSFGFFTLCFFKHSCLVALRHCVEEKTFSKRELVSLRNKLALCLLKVNVIHHGSKLLYI